MVLPNPELGPMTSLWWLEMVLLATFSCVLGYAMIVIQRVLKRKDDADEKQDQRLKLIEESIQREKLTALQRDNGHQRLVQELQMSILECQKSHCTLEGRLITKEEHHGDILRLQRMQEDKSAELLDAIREIHRRMDQALLKQQLSFGEGK